VLSFALLMLAVAEWSLGYTFELVADSLSAKLLWAKVQYLGIVSVPLLWFVFAWQYVERHQWLTRNRLLLLSIVPTTTFLFVWTNEFHGLIWQQTLLAQSGSLTILEVSYGIWFWVHSIYSYLLLLIGSIILLQAFGRFSSAYRWQVIILLLGPLAPWIGNALYITGFSPISALDLTPLAFAISGAIFAWGIFRLHLFDIVPIARRALIDSMADGMLVVDLQNRLVEMNPAFLKITGLTEEAVIGRPINELLADRPIWGSSMASQNNIVSKAIKIWK
jgi:PAS domain-containing protein